MNTAKEVSPRDLGLTQHASLISWQRRSIAVWQLNATPSERPILEEKRDTSPDQFCPTTSRARLSKLRAYSSKEDVPSHPDQSKPPLFQTGLFGHPHLHISHSSGEESPSDRADRSRHMPWLMWLIRKARNRFLSFQGRRRARHAAHTSRNFPMRGGCAQTHTIPRVQTRPNTFTQRCVPHFWHLGRRPLKTTTSTKCLEPLVSLDTESPSFSRALSKAMIGSLRCSSHSSSLVWFVFKMLSLRADHRNLLSCLWLPSWPTELWPFDHLVFWLLLPYSLLCNKKTALHTQVLQFLSKLLGNKRASLRSLQAVLTKLFPQCDQHWCTLCACPLLPLVGVRSPAPSLKTSDSSLRIVGFSLERP